MIVVERGLAVEGAEGKIIPKALTYSESVHGS